MDGDVVEYAANVAFVIIGDCGDGELAANSAIVIEGDVDDGGGAE